MGTSKTALGTTVNSPSTGDRPWGTDQEQINNLVLDWLAANAIDNNIQKESIGSLLSIAASGTITPTATIHTVEGASGAQVADTTTAIADGSETGQKLRLRGTSNTNTLEIQDGSNTVMRGDVILGLDDLISFVWDGTDWIETSRST